MSTSSILLCPRRRGFVLLSVLMLGTVLLAAATAFTWFARSVGRIAAGKRTRLEQRTWARVVVTSAVNMLSTMADNTSYDAPSQRWYQPFAINFEGEAWTLKITPLDDKIPLRSLFLPDGNTLRNEFTDVWEDLWRTMDKPTMANIVLDFMDKNDKGRVGSIDGSDWLNRPPYHTGELLYLSRDITPSMLERLEQYLTVWSDGRINLNAAPVNVLTLLPGLDTGGMSDRVANWRNDHAFTALSDIERVPGADARLTSRLNNIAGVKSRYVSLELAGPNREFYAVADKSTRTIMEWKED